MLERLRILPGTAVAYFCFVALLIFHWGTFVSIYQGWLSSETYNHGFVIVPLSAYFAWNLRDRSLTQPVSIWLPGLMLVAALSAIWTIMTLVNLQVVAQLASVALVTAIVASIAGPKQVAVFTLPLAYLLFTVPFGEGIVPALMEFTADFTTSALEITGIPVFRDGLYFSTANGNFEVAKACSGVRYLLASTAVGVAFAMLVYNSVKKRIVFIAAAIVVPLIANGFRAFGIVLLAHFSDARLAVGLDHFIYGWLFFGIVTFVLFVVGAHYADDEDKSVPSDVETSATAALPDRATTRRQIGMGIVVVLVILAGPVVVHSAGTQAGRIAPGFPDIAFAKSEWQGPGVPGLNWDLAYIGADAQLSGSYSRDVNSVEVRAAAYARQNQGQELVNSENRIADDSWTIDDHGSRTLQSDYISKVGVSSIRSGGLRYTVWHWYVVGGNVTANIYRAKWYEILSLFGSERTLAAVVAVGAVGGVDETDAILDSFVSSHADTLSACLGFSAPEESCVTSGSTGVIR